jgi:hypothetical protein
MLLTGVDPATILRVLSISEAELAAKRSAIVKALSSPAAQGPVGSGRIGPATPRRVEVG